MIPEFSLFGYPILLNPLSPLLSPRNAVVNLLNRLSLCTHTRPNAHQTFILEGLAHAYDDRTGSLALLAYHNYSIAKFCSHVTLTFRPRSSLGSSIFTGGSISTEEPASTEPSTKTKKQTKLKTSYFYPHSPQIKNPWGTNCLMSSVVPSSGNENKTSIHSS